MNVINLNVNLVFLERKLLKLQEKEQKMDNNCELKEWFRIRNDIRSIKRQIVELKYARRHG